MPFTVRRAGLVEDKLAVIEFLRRHLTNLSDESRFDWLYHQGPAGPAEVWLARDEKEGKLAGVGAAFPRQVYVKGEQLRCQVLGDFCIDPAYRSLGPALQLQRACLAAAQSGQIPFVYDFPSQAMMAIYKRLGVAAIGQMVRFVKPLSVDRKVEGLIGKGILARGVSALANRVLALQDWRVGFKDCELSIHNGSFGEEFSELDQRDVDCGSVRLSRTQDYLNWHYRGNPVRRYQVLTARQNGRLIAFAVLEVEGQDAVLVDVCGDLKTLDVGQLLTGVIELSRKLQVQAVHAPALQKSVLASRLLRAGFLAREGKPVIVSAQAGSRLVPLVTNPANWWLTQGDRDI